MTVSTCLASSSITAAFANLINLDEESQKLNLEILPEMNKAKMRISFIII